MFKESLSGDPHRIIDDKHFSWKDIELLQEKRKKAGRYDTYIDLGFTARIPIIPTGNNFLKFDLTSENYHWVIVIEMM